MNGAAQVSLAVLAKALGHPARIAIVQFLAQRKACVCADIVSHLPLAQATVSQHLKELKNAGLIRGEVDGPSVRYSIDEKIWNRTRRKMSDLFENCCPGQQF